MNKTLIALSAALSLGLAASANAADANIEFKGVINDATCSISVGTGTDTTVNLRTITANNANGTNESTRSTNFQLKLGAIGSTCPTSGVEITFLPAAHKGGKLTNTAVDGAENALLAITHNGKVLNLETDTLDDAGDNSGKYTIDLTARYEKDGADIEAGDFSAVLPIVVAYN
ncbi:fimbrial protein [Stenotrophomonas maltophilia]|uniref:fimbrial protein n=1 Tax=Stenotrophomonas TaxID=40323 RepID=UPI0003195A2B|nr:fimbrial protein [Stenotrophomonas sp. SKA14]